MEYDRTDGGPPRGQEGRPFLSSVCREGSSQGLSLGLGGFHTAQHQQSTWVAPTLARGVSCPAMWTQVNL